MLDLNKPLQTRDGQKVEILKTDRKGNYPIVVLIGEEEEMVAYAPNGRFDLWEESRLDLVNIPEEKTVWINIYDDADPVIHYSPEKARQGGLNGNGEDVREACVKVTYKVGQFDE